MKFASIASAKTKTILLEILLLLVFIVSSSCERELGVCREGMSATTLGGIHSSNGAENSIEIHSLARFAVDEHNKKQNTLLEFAKVVKAEKQVVAGVLHHLTVEAVDAGKKKVYEAKVWVKPWTDFKELQEFKHAGDATLFTSSDLGVRKDGHGTGLQEVCTNDPQVEVAAKHAVNIMQQRSNSLVPYELGHVISSKAEVAEESTEFHLVLKVKRGSKEEEFEVVVHKNNEGSFHLKDMKQKFP